MQRREKQQHCNQKFSQKNQTRLLSLLQVGKESHTHTNICTGGESERERERERERGVMVLSVARDLERR
jgi:hypothetical protein